MYVNRFTADELATIGRLGQWFCTFYGQADFNIKDAVYEALPVDPERDALVTRLLNDANLFDEFRLELAHHINEQLGANSDMAVVEANDLVYDRLGVPRTSKLMAIYPHPGFSNATVNIDQARERWEYVRMFLFDENGIKILLDLDVNALVQPYVAG